MSHDPPTSPEETSADPSAVTEATDQPSVPADQPAVQPSDAGESTAEKDLPAEHNQSDQNVESDESVESSNALPAPSTRIGSQRYPNDFASSDQSAPLAAKMPRPAVETSGANEAAASALDPFTSDESADENYGGYTSAVVDPTRRIPDASDDEIEAALGDVSMEDLLSGGGSGDAGGSGVSADATGSAAKNVGQELEIDDRVQATVVKLHRDDVFFDLGSRNQGVASLRQFEEPPDLGAKIDVVVARFNRDDGLFEVAVPGQSVTVSDWSDLVEGAVVEARVTGSNKGGLECTVNNIRGFIPASQISLYRVENMEEYHDQKLKCLVTEANEQRRNLVLSPRSILEREREQARQELLESLEVGQIHDGTVRRVMEFGAFVDLGGVDGLVHISKLSWDRVENPSDVVQEGQQLKVRVEKIDTQTGKIALSYRDVLEDPWSNIEEKYPLGAVVPGTVSRLMNFGAFVKLESGVEGLAHISELAHHRVTHVSSVVSVGQEIDVKVMSVDKEKQRIGLSLKALQSPPKKEEKEKSSEDESADEPLRQPVVSKREGPLKGGRDRGSGGDQVGLNW